MADKDVKIKISTTADTKGAKDASKEVDKLTASEKKLDNASEQATNSIAGMRGEITRLTSELERAEIGSEDFLLKARQLDAAQTKLDTTLKTSGKGFKNVGMLVGQAGFQVQDFAVQVGAGTSALTAFSQQAPQLLGAFGPGGAVAGALLAIGAIAVKVFTEANEESKISIGNIEQTAENAADNISEDFEKIIDSIDRSSRQAEILAGRYEGIREASDKYSQSELDNAEKRRNALITINELLGKQRDLLSELQAQQQAESDKRSLTFQQEIGAQQKRVTDAETTLNLKTQELSKNEDALANLRSDLVLQNQKLEALRAQKRELEETARINKISPLGYLAAATDADLLGQVTASAKKGKAAQKKVDSDSFKGEILTADSEANRIQELIKSHEKKISQNEDAITAALTAFENASSNASIEIARISEASRTDEIVAATADAKKLLETGSSQAIEALNKLLAEATPANEAQEKVFDLVSENLKDGKVTAEDTKKVADLVKSDSISAQDAARGALLASESLKTARDEISQAIIDLTINSQDASKIAANLPILAQAISARNQASLVQVNTLINLMGILDQNQKATDQRLRSLESQLKYRPK